MSYEGRRSASVAAADTVRTRQNPEPARRRSIVFWVDGEVATFALLDQFLDKVKKGPVDGTVDRALKLHSSKSGCETS